MREMGEHGGLHYIVDEEMGEIIKTALKHLAKVSSAHLAKHPPPPELKSIFFFLNYYTALSQFTAYLHEQANDVAQGFLTDQHEKAEGGRG